MQGFDRQDGSRAERHFSRLEEGLLRIAGICLALMMFVVVGDVIGRYVFNSPFSWSYDLIGLYLMVAVFFLTLSAGLAGHHHISVDLVRNKLPVRLRNILLGIGYLASSGMIFLICWTGVERFIEAWTKGERLASSVGFPTWVPYALVALGSGVAVIRCLQRTVEHARAAITGIEPARLMPEDTSILPDA